MKAIFGKIPIKNDVSQILLYKRLIVTNWIDINLIILMWTAFLCFEEVRRVGSLGIFWNFQWFMILNERKSRKSLFHIP